MRYATYAGVTYLPLQYKRLKKWGVHFFGLGGTYSQSVPLSTKEVGQVDRAGRGQKVKGVRLARAREDTQTAPGTSFEMRIQQIIFTGI